MSNKIKVLQISNRFIIGGPSIILAILHSQMGSGFISKLLVGKKDPHEQDAKFLLDRHNVTYEEIESMKRSVNPANDIKSYREIKRHIKKFGPDVVHTHAAKPSVLGRLAAYRLKVPVIIHTYHGHVFHNYFSKPVTFFIIRLERFLARFTTKIIAISEQQKAELVETYKICRAEKVAVIPLGLDLDPFYNDQESKRAAFRNEYQIQNDEIAVGIIGRLVAVKNHELFINAIEKVLKSSSKKIRVMIIGDGDEKDNIKSHLSRLSIPFNEQAETAVPATVTFTSWLTKMDEVFAGLDIIALTSLNEGTPVALIEAQAACKPIVTTDVGGIRDIVLQDKTAFCTSSNDVNAFAKALLRLTEDDDLRKSMGNEGYSFVKANFDKSRLIADTQSLYISLLKEKGVVLS